MKRCKSLALVIRVDERRRLGGDHVDDVGRERNAGAVKHAGESIEVGDISRPRKAMGVNADGVDEVVAGRKTTRTLLGLPQGAARRQLPEFVETGAKVPSG